MWVWPPEPRTPSAVQPIIKCEKCGADHMDPGGDDRAWRCRKCEAPVRRVAASCLAFAIAAGRHVGTSTVTRAVRTSPVTGSTPRHRLPGEVGEQPLPGRVDLPHGRRQPCLARPVELAPAAVLVPTYASPA